GVFALAILLLVVSSAASSASIACTEMFRAEPRVPTELDPLLVCRADGSRRGVRRREGVEQVQQDLDGTLRTAQHCLMGAVDPFELSLRRGDSTQHDADLFILLSGVAAARGWPGDRVGAGTKAGAFGATHLRACDVRVE